MKILNSVKDKVDTDPVAKDKFMGVALSLFNSVRLVLVVNTLNPATKLWYQSRDCFKDKTCSKERAKQFEILSNIIMPFQDAKKQKDEDAKKAQLVSQYMANDMALKYMNVYTTAQDDTTKMKEVATKAFEDFRKKGTATQIR